MNLLKDLSQVSSYRPIEGDVLKLFKLAVEQELPKKDIVHFFQPPSYFRQTKKRLKDKLLDGILLNSFSHLSKVQQQHFKIRKRSLETIMLIQSEKKKSAIIIAEETLAAAEKLGLIDVALQMCRELSYHYATVQADWQKRKKYQEKNLALKRKFDQEWEVQNLISELAFCIQKNQPTTHVTEAVAKLEPILLENHEYKFRLFYYSLLILNARYNSSYKEVIRICKEATNFFNRNNKILPYTTKWNFKFQMLPVYLNQKDFASAEHIIGDCLTLPSRGSYNWHLTLLYKVVLGLHSDKIPIAISAWQEAQQTPKKFESEVIENRWKIITAYLVFLDRIGRTSFSSKFKLKKFLNDTKPNNTSKANLIIIELLYLLINKKKKEFMKKADNIESYLQYQRSKITQRTRHFLRMMTCIESGDYNQIRVASHAKRNYDNLKKLSSTININILDSEPVPYERLWGLVLSILKAHQKSKRGR